MRKISDRILAAITSVLLVAIAGGITAVCFIPQKGTEAVSVEEEYKPIYGVEGGDKVALTINVYEGADIVEEMLETLKSKGAKATFFVGGCWADKNENTLVKILEYGCEIGSHGYFHKDHSKLDEAGNREEMVSCENLVRRITGEDITLFAPPSGAYSKATLLAAQKLGYKTIMWTKDTIDWRDKDEELVFKRATDNIKGGDFVLMHPKEHTLKALGRILDYYSAAGLKAVTVSECLQ